MNGNNGITSAPGWLHNVSNGDVSMAGGVHDGCLLSRCYVLVRLLSRATDFVAQQGCGEKRYRNIR